MWAAAERWESPLSKGPENKTGNHPVVSARGRYECRNCFRREVNSHVVFPLRSEHAHAQAEGNVWHASISKAHKDYEAPPPR